MVRKVGETGFSPIRRRVGLNQTYSQPAYNLRSILRDAVEFVAHAHHMLKDPEIQKIWLNKNDNEEAFKKEFWYGKETGLFAGLDELYEVWCQLSEIGSHANLN